MLLPTTPRRSKNHMYEHSNPSTPSTDVFINNLILILGDSRTLGHVIIERGLQT